MALRSEGPMARWDWDYNPESHGMWLCCQCAPEAEHMHTGSDGLENNKHQRDTAMTNGLRWRIFVLQVGLIGILAFVSGFAFWASNFATSAWHVRLAAQQISFPAAASQAIASMPKVDAAA